ncbi:hypothetical protein A3C59_05530 [Candidatus Daviesbacteria bacterium RIFCSPHIGHO2_02_FULL_36_13]|uniref:DUF5652 domain-containing protein n=1 Tax=Candidatus Daviesbacteria bacterium RIFCSPHIGHO2_02_FULL_36_13 TaxID=1797768 RepID=A0A1F5JPE7_9BACT|nr:MAG: hypothetical protein A3C59_05530 [Candidatus Daviesbacteria bacterium RIFCSPHIGHO2_02_FULL_36_13]
MSGELFNNLGIFFFVLWEAFWKAMGLWRSAKAGSKLWFFGIFIINSFGILPLFYLWKTKQLNGVLEDLKLIFTSRFKK